jgi:hypothetical protein
LHQGGFNPLPLSGKRPAFEGWQKRTDATEHEISYWERSYPAAENTGVLTKFAPTFDIDVLDHEAAAAVERLARERFEELGNFLVRVGNFPRRAIPIRTDAPFKKITALLISPGGEEEKLEFLCDGQQVVVHGVHPDTLKPYAWHADASPGKIRRQELPYIDAKAAQALFDDAVELLVREFGYRRPVKAKKAKGRATKGNGAADWGEYLVNLGDHDVLAAFAMALVRSGMSDGAATNFPRTQVDGLTDIDPDRKARRLKEITGMIASARAKLDGEAAPQFTPPEPPEGFVNVKGVEKRLTTLADLNERFALLDAPSSASVYVSRAGPTFCRLQTWTSSAG